MTEYKQDFFFQFIKIRIFKCIFHSLRSKQFFVSQVSSSSEDKGDINLTTNRLALWF